MPCQADALNDLSLMPPVSVTMHPRNEVPEAPAVLVAADVAAGLVAAGALVVLLPQAASSRLVAAAAAVAIKAVCLTGLLHWTQVAGAQASRGYPLAQTARSVRLVNVRWEEPRRHCGHVVAEPRPLLALGGRLS